MAALVSRSNDQGLATALLHGASEAPSTNERGGAARDLFHRHKAARMSCIPTKFRRFGQTVSDPGLFRLEA